MAGFVRTKHFNYNSHSSLR